MSATGLATARAGLIALPFLLAPAAYAAETIPLVLETQSGEHRFEVEIANTDEKRTIGLMYRRSLGENAGMLFLYHPPQPISMWMRNTYIPLDMIFISPDDKVHRIVERTEPFSLQSIPSGGTVKGILEVNAGVAAKTGLKPGDAVRYSLPAPAPAQ